MTPQNQIGALHIIVVKMDARSKKVKPGAGSCGTVRPQCCEGLDQFNGILPSCQRRFVQNEISRVKNESSKRPRPPIFVLFSKKDNKEVTLKLGATRFRLFLCDVNCCLSSIGKISLRFEISRENLIT